MCVASAVIHDNRPLVSASTLVYYNPAVSQHGSPNLLPNRVRTVLSPGSRSS